MDRPDAKSQRSDVDYRNKRYCDKCNHFRPVDEFEVLPITSGQNVQGDVAKQLCRSCAQARMSSEKMGNTDGNQQAHAPQSRYKSLESRQIPSVLQTRSDQRHGYDRDPIHNRTGGRSSPVDFVDDTALSFAANWKEQQAVPVPIPTQSQDGGSAFPTFNSFTHERAVEECQALWVGLEHSNTNLRRCMNKNAELETRNLALLREIVEVQCRAEAAEKGVEELRRRLMRGDQELPR